MNTAQATVERHGPRGSDLKFVYASGSRPLDGYTIRRGLGRGGFGEVYFATSDGGKEVALKLVRRNLEIELRGVQQCLNLKHPHLISLYDIRQDAQGDTWVIMEFVAGESLEETLARYPQGLPQLAIRRWFDGLCAAVAYLHDRGIVHRDLKPGNVFCDGDVSVASSSDVRASDVLPADEGLIKLGDYGLSKFVSVSRRSGQTESVGTVHYMAPEIAHGSYGKEIDIYALGVILYEMLTGRVPFEGESVGEVLMKHLTAQPDLSSVPEPLSGILAACLDKDPTKRPTSAAELQRQVAEALGAEPSASRVTGAQESPVSSRSLSSQPQSDEGTLSGWQRGWNRLDEAKQLQFRFLAITALLAAAAALSPTLRGAGYEMFLSPITRSPQVIVALSLLLPTVIVVTSFALLRRSSSASHRRPLLPETLPHPDSDNSMNQPTILAERVDVPVMRRDPYRIAYESPSAQAWVGALLMSSVVSAAGSLMLILVRGAAVSRELYVWLVLTATLGSWLVLGLQMMWQARPIEPAQRRFVTGLAGLVLGAFACLLDHFLLVDLPFDLRTTRSSTGPFFDSVGQPEWLAFLAHFGLMFVLIGWWRQADGQREKRVSINSLIAVAALAWVLNFMAGFPQPWGIFVAVVISLAVQLSAPWRPRPSVLPQPFFGPTGQWVRV